MDDATLAALLKQGAPPAQDWRFTLAVMARVEQRQFHRSLLRNIGLGLAALLLLAVAAPALTATYQDLAAPLSNELIAAAIVLGAMIFAWPWMAQQD